VSLPAFATIRSLDLGVAAAIVRVRRSRTPARPPALRLRRAPYGETATPRGVTSPASSLYRTRPKILGLDSRDRALDAGAFRDVPRQNEPRVLSPASRQLDLLVHLVAGTPKRQLLVKQDKRR
jgi:hypothetical protein